MNLQHDNPAIVIVGASLAGVSAAETLRAEGWKGEIVLLSQEKAMPYDRPPLSKEALREAVPLEKLLLRDRDFYDAQRIDLRLGTAATAIDTAKKQVALSDGSSLAYQKLLLATGSRVRQVERFPYGAAQVHYLRELDDALKLRQEMMRVADKGHVLVVGAGIIGLEVAAIAAEMNLKATVVEVGARPLARAASSTLAAFLSDAHARHGVDIRCGVQIIEAKPVADGYEVRLSDETCLHADLVVVGAGVVPNSELARSAGIDTAPEGIRVDGQGRTSAADVYAAGEVAFHYNELHGAHRREETWQHAISHGGHVARCMLGADDAYAEPMSYWTDQYDYSVLVFGSPLGVRDVVRGDVRSGGFIVFHMDEDGICGLTAVNAARDMRKCKPLVLAHASVPDEVIRNLEEDLTHHCAAKA